MHIASCSTTGKCAQKVNEKAFHYITTQSPCNYTIARSPYLGTRFMDLVGGEEVVEAVVGSGEVVSEPRPCLLVHESSSILTVLSSSPAKPINVSQYIPSKASTDQPLAATRY
jgi:hypothetical protein